MARNPKSEAENPEAKQPDPEALAPAAKDAEAKQADTEASAPAPDAETTAVATGAETPEIKQPEDLGLEPSVVVVITATAARRRRAGRSFGLTPVRIPANQLTDEDYDALAADPLLKIQLEAAEQPAGD